MPKEVSCELALIMKLIELINIVGLERVPLIPYRPYRTTMYVSFAKYSKCFHPNSLMHSTCSRIPGRSVLKSSVTVTPNQNDVNEAQTSRASCVYDYSIL
jgi:hypothetical protein